MLDCKYSLDGINFSMCVYVCVCVRVDLYLTLLYYYICLPKLQLHVLTLILCIIQILKFLSS